jgi:hypothetical protein
MVEIESLRSTVSTTQNEMIFVTWDLRKYYLVDRLQTTTQAMHIFL